MSVEFVGIELELRGGDRVKSDLDQIDKIINSLRGKKQLDMGLDKLRRELVAARGELEKFQRLREKYLEAGGEGDAYVNEIKEAKYHLKDVQQAIREVQTASKSMGSTFMQTFRKVSSVTAHIGSSMQSLGNALTRLTAPLERVTTGALLGAGYKAFGMFTEGLSSGFTRYDTMKKFPKIMAQLGYSSKEADKSIQKLDASVQGLPIALDDAVGLAQRYIATTGSLTKGTDLAIAANNAFLASMSTETQRYQGMMQLQDVIGGKKMNAREWYSLANSMMPAIRQMGKYLGYTGEELDDYVKKVSQGKIANEDFINTLIKAGTDENGSIRKMALESMDTYEAFFSRIGTAASRMMYGTIKALDEVSRAATGMDVNQLLDKKFIPAIDRGTESIKKWIQAHPEEIKEFFKDLASINWTSLIKGFAEGMAWIAKLIDGFAKSFGDKDLSGVGRRLIKANILGKLLTIVGGLVKGMRIPVGFIGALISKFGKGGLFGSLFTALFGSKGMTGATEGAKEIPTVANTFKSAFSALEGLIKAAGAIVIVSGTGFVAFKAAKSILKDLKEMTDIVNSGNWDNVGYVGSGVILAIGTFTEIFNAIGGALGAGGLLNVAIAGAASAIVSGTLLADTEMIKRALVNVRKTIQEFDNVGQAITDMKGLVAIDDSKKQALKDSVSSIIDIYNILNGKSGSPMDRGVTQQGIPWVTGMKANSMKNIASMLKNMTKVVNQVNKLASLTISEGAETQVKNLTKSINAIIKAMPTMTQGGMQGPKNLAANTKSLANALYQMRRMAYSINQLAGTTVNTSGFSTFIASLKEAMQSLQDVSGDLELDITVKLNDGFQKSVDAVIKKIKNAKDKIKKQKKGISFKIPVHVTFSVSTNLGAALATINKAREALNSATRGNKDGSNNNPANRYQAMGGMIYRAGGGGVPFKRRGTDTVPAMLTPGEYVQRKQAVNYFGIDFMRKINSLDVRGAMSDLMARAGSMASVNRGTVVNNTYNNNQRAIINVKTNSPDYTSRLASRFVGAF